MTRTSSNGSGSLALTRGYTLAVVSAVILSTTAIFIKHLSETYHVPPLVLAFWRDFFVAVPLLVLLAVFRPALLQVSRKHLGYLALYGLVLTGFNAIWTVSVAVNGAAIGTVMAYGSVGFTAVLGWWWLKERLDWAKGGAVLLNLGGCVLVSGVADPAAWQLNLVGILTGVLSGLGYAGYSMMGRSANQRGLSPWTAILYTFGFAALYFLVINLLPVRFEPAGMQGRPGDLLWLGEAWRGWFILFLLGAGPTLGGFGLYNLSMTHLPSSVANLIATLEPVSTALLAYFLLSERFTLEQVLGSVMILSGIIFLRLYEGWLVRAQAESVPA